MNTRIEISYAPTGGSGSLSVEFIRVKNRESLFPVEGEGRYWLDGETLAGAEFTDVSFNNDKQRMETDDGQWVEVEVSNGKIQVSSSTIQQEQRLI